MAASCKTEPGLGPWDVRAPEASLGQWGLGGGEGGVGRGGERQPGRHIGLHGDRLAVLIAVGGGSSPPSPVLIQELQVLCG